MPEDSILTTTKKALGLAEDYTPFDTDVTMHINAVLSELNQLGIGPIEGFAIVDANSTWVDFLGPEPRYNMVKSWVYLKVRMLFDPPQLGYVITAWEKVLEQMTFRIAVMRDDVNSPYIPDELEQPDPIVVDGGGA